MANIKDRGTVKVVDGRYKFKGNFHYINPNSPIRNEDGELMGVTNPRDITHVHMYGGEAPFFESLKDGKLLGTRCDNPACENELSPSSNSCRLSTLHILFLQNT